MQSLVDFGRNTLRNVILSHPKCVCNYKMQNICVQTNIRGPVVAEYTYKIF